MKKDKNIVKNQKGQALVEFLLFLPFMLMMYSVIVSVSNAINASINQQKVTRAYFYYRMQNNSTIPKPRRDGVEPYMAWDTFGMQIMGWNEKLFDNASPVATCVKLNLPLKDLADDSCEEAYTTTKTQYIRIGTVYGMCGATYVRNNLAIHRLPSGSHSPLITVSEEACQIK